MSEHVQAINGIYPGIDFDDDKSSDSKYAILYINSGDTRNSYED